MPELLVGFLIGFVAGSMWLWVLAPIIWSSGSSQDSGLDS